MEEKFRIIVFLVPIFINFILLYLRKRRWVRNKYKWCFLLILAIISFYIFVTNYSNSSTTEKMLEWTWMTPIIFSLVDLILMKLSFLIHDRDFYLWLRGSSEIDDTKLGGSHIKNTDRFFSMFLLIFLIASPFIILLFI